MLLLLVFVSIPEISLALVTSSADPQELLLDREQGLIADESVTLKEREQILLAEPLENIPSATQPIEKIEAAPINLPTSLYRPFPCAAQKKFCANTLTAEKIVLPPISAELAPFGAPPKKKRIATQKPSAQQAAALAAAEVAKKKEAEEQAAVEEKKKAEEVVALSPFLAWVKENKEKAAETAKEASLKYKKAAPPKQNPEDQNDLFLSIRFPYKGTESSGSSMAIYSTPEK